MSDVVMRYLAEANAEYQRTVERAIVYAMEQGFHFDDLVLLTPVGHNHAVQYLAARVAGRELPLRLMTFTKTWTATPKDGLAFVVDVSIMAKAFFHSRTDHVWRPLDVYVIH